MSLDALQIKKLIKERSLYLCQECGKCTASCPRMLTGKEYSPRLVAQKLMAQPDDVEFIERTLWECLTCGLCEERCPSGVEFGKLILQMRTLMAADKGLTGYRAHDGALHSWMRIMTSPDIQQNRLDWIGPELSVAAKGPVAYFTGCAPYFDVFFSNIEANTLDISRNAIRLLNHMGIEPVVLGNERCCGHDLLWSGDRENFETLCQLNYQSFKDAGVEEIVVTCPECYQVLAKNMPEVIPGYDLKVTLLIDMLEREAQAGRLTFKPLEQRVTYQDPCRLGRMADRTEEPRALMQAVPGLELAEMANHGRSSLCCGNSAFVNCDAYSKRIQVMRLKEARATGADLLVTACPKCHIHLSCAMRDPFKDGPMQMPTRDLISLLAEQLEDGEE